MELIKIVGLIAVLLFAAAKASAQSNDVYNFYFQKGQAPGSVVQGGQQQSSPQAPAPPQQQPAPVAQPQPDVINNVVVAPAATGTAPALRYNRHEFTLGPTYLNDEVSEAMDARQAWAIGYQHNFNRYISAFGQGHFFVNSSTRDDRPGVDRDDPDYLYGGMLGVAITPIHLDLFGHKFLRVSALFGGRTERVITYEINNPVDTKIRPLIGASAEVFLNENVGIRGSVAMGTEEFNKNEIAQATGSLVMSF